MANHGGFSSQPVEVAFGPDGELPQYVSGWMMEDTSDNRKN